MKNYNLHIEQQPRELGYQYPRLEGMYLGQM